MLHIPPSRLYSHKGAKIKENKKIGKGEVEGSGKTAEQRSEIIERGKRWENVEAHA
jgi:hypothetical protein